MRIVFTSLLCCMFCIAGCQDRASVEDTSGATDVPGSSVPITTASAAPAAPGIPVLTRQWEYQLPAEAAIYKDFETHVEKATGEVAFGPDGTVYFLARALPSAKDLFEEADRHRNMIIENDELPPKDRSFRVSQLIYSQNIHAPKETWLYALNPDGTNRWIFKAPGDPVNRPYVATNGDIVFGTYAAQSVAFDPNEPRPSAPLENVGGLFVVNPTGKLVREIDPGGWVDAVHMGRGDTIICLVNDRGRSSWLSTYGRADGLPKNRSMINKYVALTLTGEVLWTVGGKFSNTGTKFLLVDADHGGEVLGTIGNRFTTLDIATGEVVERAANPVGIPKYSVRILDGSIFEGTESTYPWRGLNEGSLTCEQANETGLLTLFNPAGEFVGELPLGCGFKHLAAGPDGGAAVIRSYIYESEDFPGENIYENYVTYVDSTCNPVWDYEDPKFNPFDKVKVDADGNVYAGAYVSTTGRQTGVISLDPAGNLRWECYCSPLHHKWKWSLGPDGQLYIPTADSLIAFAPAG